jgi:hypothetical protein
MTSFLIRENPCKSALSAFPFVKPRMAARRKLMTLGEMKIKMGDRGICGPWGRDKKN